MTLRLRDIEVANDDFERQTRNQTSSLEDLEQKYNISIERGVMLEEELKVGEQEREDLRIENQRLRDELADLSIEADIVKEKLRAAEDTIHRHRAEKTHALVTADHVRSRSPVSETSTSATTVSSPTTSTPPPAKSNRTSATTPPSPNFAEFMDRSKDIRGVRPMRTGSIALHDNTPRPRDYGPQRTRHHRDPSVPWSSISGRSSPTRPRARRPTAGHSYKPSGDGALPRSGSLYQIRGLIGKMQKLEARVHNVRSKLPAPTNTPPKASPRNGSAQSNHSHVPSSTTVRSGRARTSASTTSSNKDGEDNAGVSRLNFGASKNSGVTGFMSAPPSDNLSNSSRPTSRGSELSGVSNGYTRPVSRSSGRPPSRNSNPNTGRNAPLNPFSQSTHNAAEARRPRTSAANSSSSFYNNDRYGGPTRTRTRTRANTRSQFDDLDEPGVPRHTLSTPVTRTKPDFSRSVGSNSSGIPTPGGFGTGIPTPSSGLPRRMSTKGRRPSVDTSVGAGIPPVPLLRPSHNRKLSEVGETW